MVINMVILLLLLLLLSTTNNKHNNDTTNNDNYDNASSSWRYSLGVLGVAAGRAALSKETNNTYIYIYICTQNNIYIYI